MAMGNPYAAYQKFNKKKNSPAEGVKNHSLEEEVEKPAAEKEMAPVAKAVPTEPVKPKYQPPRPAVQNPNVYKMQKKVTLHGEEPEEGRKEAGNGRREEERKAANPYLESQVMTATPEELVRMMYDGAVRFANLAVKQLEEDDRKAAHESSLRVQAIVTELMGSLDLTLPVAAQMMSLYDYIKHVLAGANVEKDVEKTRHALELLKEMRGTWKEAMVIARTEAEARAEGEASQEE